MPSMSRQTVEILNAISPAFVLLVKINKKNKKQKKKKKKKWPSCSIVYSLKQNLIIDSSSYYVPHVI